MHKNWQPSCIYSSRRAKEIAATAVELVVEEMRYNPFCSRQLKESFGFYSENICVDLVLQRFPEQFHVGAELTALVSLLFASLRGSSCSDKKLTYLFGVSARN